ncbi:MAG: hypothetical protein ACTSUE_17900 [Promethearchaeota archaeon]
MHLLFVLSFVDKKTKIKDKSTHFILVGCWSWHTLVGQDGTAVHSCARGTCPVKQARVPSINEFQLAHVSTNFDRTIQEK